jgi:hypothetical protein
MEEVPIQWLAVGLQARHQLLLHRNTGYMIMRAEKYLRWAFEILHRIIGMTRS